MDKPTPPESRFAPGQECEHGQLARSCGLCDRDYEIAELRAQVAQYKEDAERLHYVLRRLPGSIIRALIGVMSDTGDIHEFRAAIDKARKTT